MIDMLDSRLRRAGVAAILTGVGLALAAPAGAAPVTFASFFPDQFNNGTSQNVVWGAYKNGTVTQGTSGELQTANSSGDFVDFKFGAIGGSLPPALTSVQDAKLTITESGATTAQASTSGGVVSQSLGQTLTLTFSRWDFATNTAAPITVGGKELDNLLTVTIGLGTADAKITGSHGTNSATLDATSASNTLTFSSDFLSFADEVETDAILGFTGISPAIGIKSNFLAAFKADMSGQFDADPTASVTTPEPASGAVYLIGLLGLVGMRAYRRR